MNLVNLKVIHQTNGIGTVIAQSDNQITVEFSVRTSKFVYPNAFVGFLTCENPLMQNEILQEIAASKAAAEEQKRAEEEAKQRVEEERAAETAARRAIAASTSAHKAVPSALPRIPGKRMTFFVFQGTTYDRESRGGYIWAPVTNKAGNTFHHWDRLLDIRPGDIILHGLDGYVRAVSTARGECYPCIQPVELSSEELWDRDGRRVDCDYITIRNAIKTSDFLEDIIRLCNVKYAPFDRNGSGNMGYLYEIDRDLARIFLRASARFNPTLSENDFVQELLRRLGMIEVTAAIICKGKEFLICQRPKGKNCELLWEFPGGKIESGETEEQCIVRECQEELGVTLRVIRKLTEVTYDYPGRTVHLHFFITEITAGDLAKNEHHAFRWISPEKTSNYTFCPADAKMLSTTDMRAVLAES